MKSLPINVVKLEMDVHFWRRGSEFIDVYVFGCTHIYLPLSLEMPENKRMLLDKLREGADENT